MDNNKEKDDDLLNTIMFNKYKILRKIGEGSFGKIYKGKIILNLGINIESKQQVAIKLVILFLILKGI